MTSENVPPNWLHPEAVQAVLDLSARPDTPDRQSQMLFSPSSRHVARDIYTVFVESTPEGDWWRAPTQEERRAKRKAEWDAERERECALIAAHAELMTTATGLRRAVLELHAPEDGGCAGCESCCCRPTWPCTSYALARDWKY